jgi:hypothetical protein
MDQSLIAPSNSGMQGAGTMNFPIPQTPEPSLDTSAGVGSVSLQFFFRDFFF